MPMTFVEAQALFEADRRELAARGVIALDETCSYVPDGYGVEFSLAMDSQPQLVTTPSGGIPAFLTTYIDPKVYEVVLAPTKGAEILEEVKTGDWKNDTAMFQAVEAVGEVSSYGDYSNNGNVGINTSFDYRQNYLFQTVKNVGDREIEQLGEARINGVAAKDKAAAAIMNQFLNSTYHFGVAGLQNYGLVNDPGIARNTTLSPGLKAAGGARWIDDNNVVKATANEVYNDITSLYAQLVAQTGGNVQTTDKLKLVISAIASVAMTATNNFNVSVGDLLKKNFPNLEIVTSPLYGVRSPMNPKGLAGGNLIQLIAVTVGGQDTGYTAFSEKMRAHAVVRDLSSYKQKMTGGSYGAVIRQPFAVAQMLGV